MPYRRGDVVLVLFPESNLRSAKRRPGLIIQADQLNTGLAQTIVAMITSNLSREDHSSRVRINRDSPAGKRAGLLTESVVMTDNVATVREKEIDRKLGYLDDMKEVDAALRHTLLLP